MDDGAFELRRVPNMQPEQARARVLRRASSNYVTLHPAGPLVTGGVGCDAGAPGLSNQRLFNGAESRGARVGLGRIGSWEALASAAPPG